VSSKELVKAYISRIKEINPIVNAVVQDNFNAAMEEAEAVDLYIRNQDANSEEFNMVLHKDYVLS
jgi:fatty acid amide hydrolase 2